MIEILIKDKVHKMHEGTCVFEYNIDTKECKKAKMKMDLAKEINTVVVNDNCVYLPAINKENALKKINKVVK